jgi:aconitase B
MLLMMIMMVLLLLMMMIIGITLRDLVHAIPYYVIQEGMRKMMILTIYHHPISSNHDYLHLCTINIYLSLYTNVYLTVEKKGKKIVFNGRILEIEGR